MREKLFRFMGITVWILLGVFVMGDALAQEQAPEETPRATRELSDLPAQVDVMQEGLFPEGVVYDPVNDRFFVSSVAEGTVYAVDFDGALTPFVEDERIPSSLGLEVDAENNRLLVVATDMETQALLGIYDLTTGENLMFVDFKPLLPDPERFANDVAVDASGNAYVTDSLAGVIYSVDMQGNASIFLTDETFSTNFALNGIAYHEEGNYLIAVLLPGLIKIPLENPAGFTPVALDREIDGEDGITFLADGSLAVVSKVQGRVYRVESADDFQTAQVTGAFETGPVFPTTVTAVGETAYVLHAQINEQDTPIENFPIQQVEFTEDILPEATEESE